MNLSLIFLINFTDLLNSKKDERSSDKTKVKKQVKDNKKLKETLNLMHNETVRTTNETCDENLIKDSISSEINKYNAKSMTKMTTTNLDSKRLKETPVMGLEEINLRESLGPLICNAVDKYMSKI